MLIIREQMSPKSPADDRFEDARRQLLRILVHHMLHIAGRANLTKQRPTPRMLESAYNQWASKAVFEWRVSPCDEDCGHPTIPVKTHQSEDTASVQSSIDQCSLYNHAYERYGHVCDVVQPPDSVVGETESFVDSSLNDVPLFPDQAPKLLSQPTLLNNSGNRPKFETMCARATFASMQTAAGSSDSSAYDPTTFRPSFAGALQALLEDSKKTPSSSLEYDCSDIHSCPVPIARQGDKTISTSPYSQTNPPPTDTSLYSRDRDGKNDFFTPDRRTHKYQMNVQQDAPHAQAWLTQGAAKPCKSHSHQTSDECRLWSHHLACRPASSFDGRTRRLLI